MTPSDVKIVADNINDFIEVPDGLSRIKKAVLTLAVSGKLVPQENKEGTAEKLYAQVLKERQKSSGKKEVEYIPEITEESFPYEIPKTWKWVPFGNVIELVYGDGLPKEHRHDNGKYHAYGANGPLSNTDLINCKEGGIIVGRKGSAGAVTLVPEPFFATDVTYYIPNGQFSAFDAEYLFHLLTAIDLPKYAKGIKPGISRKEVYVLPIPLPPISEQKRIVTKIHSLLKQLTELESQKIERDLVRSRLTRSAMQALGTADSEIAFDKLTELIKTQEDVKELENAILNLGISGRLIKPSSGSVDGLYENIRNERRLLETDSSTRKKKITTLDPVADSEIPFEIPSSWKWVRLGEIFLIERGGSPRPIESYVTEDPQGLNWIKIGDTEKGGKYISSTKERIIKEGLKKTRQVHSGDLLLTNSMSFGRPYILKIDGCIHDGWLVLHPYQDDLIRDFYYYALSSPVFFQQFLNLVSGAVVKNLNAEKVRSVLIPLPPIAEQKQIVEKIEELMKMVKELKTIISN